jgi:hypothetical protein
MNVLDGRLDFGDLKLLPLVLQKVQIVATEMDAHAHQFSLVQIAGRGKAPGIRCIKAAYLAQDYVNKRSSHGSKTATIFCRIILALDTSLQLFICLIR